MNYSVGPESDLSLPLVVRQYVLSVNKEGNGGVFPDIGEHFYIEGTAVLLVTMPAAGSRFVRWEGDNVEDQNCSPTQITMNGNKSVKAVFKEEATLTLVSTRGGSTVPEAGVIAYVKDSSVTLKAVPNEGYCFAGWTGDIVESGDTYTLVMDSDKTVGATFTESPTITASKKKLYYGTAKEKGFWNIDGKWMFFATPRHSQLKELEEDNHTQYLNNERHDTTERHTLGVTVPHDTASGVGALPNLSGEELPVASADYRGQFFTVLGGAGPPAVEDKLYWCRSTDGGTAFEWKEVSLV